MGKNHWIIGAIIVAALAPLYAIAYYLYSDYSDREAVKEELRREQALQEHERIRCAVLGKCE